MGCLVKFVCYSLSEVAFLHVQFGWLGSFQHAESLVQTVRKAWFLDLTIVSKKWDAIVSANKRIVELSFPAQDHRLCLFQASLGAAGLSNRCMTWACQCDGHT